MTDLKGFENCDITFENNINNLTKGGYLIEVSANPLLGFCYPYLLFIPINVNNDSTIIVEGSNTEKETRQIFDIAKDKDIIAKAIDDVREYFKAGHPIKKINEETANYPFLYPLFPRLRYHGKTFWNHMLSSNSMFTKENEEELKQLGIYRTDLQLMAMIKDASTRLKKYGLNVDEKVILYGFSSSAQCVNRFTLLHPEIVKYAFAGALGGMITLPYREINGEKTLWPIGIGNVEEITDEKLELYKKVPQFYFQGVLDDNDCFQPNDFGTSRDNDLLQDEEAVQLYSILGRDMNITRWKNTERIITNLNTNISMIFSQEYGHNPHMMDGVIEEVLKEAAKKRNI